MPVQQFPKTLKLADFTEVETDVRASGWTVTHELAPEEGQAYSLGRGRDATQTDAVGRLYADIQNSTPADIDCSVRFTVRTLQDRLVTVINEYDGEELRTGASNRTDRYPFPIQRFQASGKTNRYVARGFKLCIEIRSDSGTATVSTSDSTLKADGYLAEKTA